MIAIRLERDGRVNASCSTRVALPAATVWGQMRDWRRFLALDPLHRAVEVLDELTASPEGVRLVIPHRLFGIGPNRVGRVLRWEEGRGYAISDLSRRGARAGFPHVCVYDLRGDGPSASILTVSARGLWTATWTPMVLRRLWLWWVLRATEGLILAELERFAAWRSRRTGPIGPLAPSPPLHERVSAVHPGKGSGARTP